jgi:hypothetical protein
MMDMANGVRPASGFVHAEQLLPQGPSKLRRSALLDPHRTGSNAWLFTRSADTRGACVSGGTSNLAYSAFSRVMLQEA